MRVPLGIRAPWMVVSQAASLIDRLTRGYMRRISSQTACRNGSDSSIEAVTGVTVLNRGGMTVQSSARSRNWIPRCLARVWIAHINAVAVVSWPAERKVII